MEIRKRNKLVFGVGVNDADYNVVMRVDGKRVHTCPYYSRWAKMLERCYDEKYQIKKPTYIGCSVIGDWFIFSNFKMWMEKQDWEGKQLDKDLLVNGNRVYSPNTCVFIHETINIFTTDRRLHRGVWPLGVYFKKANRRFVAQCSNPFTGGPQEYLGLFDTPKEAHFAWKARKHSLACQLADSEYVTDERVANALRKRYAPDTDWLQGWEDIR